MGKRTDDSGSGSVPPGGEAQDGGGEADCPEAFVWFRPETMRNTPKSWGRPVRIQRTEHMGYVTEKKKNQTYMIYNDYGDE